jgi:hypothetical protein
MVADMPTPQLAAAAPVKLCPLCGRRMQHCGTNVTTHNYACFQHDQVFYLNYHYAFLDENGNIKVRELEKGETFSRRKVEPNYDPRLPRRSS